MGEAEDTRPDSSPELSPPHAGGDSEASVRLRWGLLPEPRHDGRPHQWNEILRYWFVDYNPLFFFSALCVLCGVVLISVGLDERSTRDGNDDWGRDQAWLFSVIQLYELLVVASAAFLARKADAARPAVLLALLESVFLLDCTFRVENISQLAAGPAGGLTVAWVVLAPCKIRALAWGLRASVSIGVYVLVTAAAAGIAGMLHAIGNPEVAKPLVLVATAWVGVGLVAATVIVKPTIAWHRPLDRTDAAKLARISKILVWIVAGFYYNHVLNYLLWVGDGAGGAFGPILGSAFLLIALLRRRENDVWIGGGLALAFGFTYPPVTSACFALVAGIWAYRAWELRLPRLAVAAVLALHGAGWLLGWAGGPIGSAPLWTSAATAAVLLALAWRFRDPLAIVVLVVVGGGYAYARGFDWLASFLPSTRLGWGTLLVALGFLALSIGVWINWQFRGTRGAASEDSSAPPE